MGMSIVAFDDEPLPVEVEVIRRIGLIRLTRKWTLGVRDGDVSRRIEVPRGYLCDGASVPLWAQAPLALGGASRLSLVRAGVMHDYLYATRLYPRRQADRYFREYARQEGVGLIGAWSSWAIVRLFGWVNWRHCSDQYRRGLKEDDR